eukprot:CAMPEP_0206136414 /NCGR_PEP_ID=MMETSP1473-20131121/1648_1 /ASSEMBLY_ACC=CAM_ASM_001109 /TAXON_ID=1461547 /ORGANISM="Stichococcus sp, Strain RCC1054" /LENGTH=665 /DNA_ID=CAMNT_0053528935 /DNA_START=263 /DNA_END=2260 /DNA_ORIENTATION=+
MLVRLSRASTFTAATSASMLMQPRLALPLPNVCGTLVSSRSSCAASGCHPHVLMRWAQAQQQMLGRLSVRMHATKQAGPRSAEVPAPQQPRGSSARMSMRSLGLPSLLVLIPGGLLLLALLTLAAAPAALAADFGAQAALRLLTSSLSADATVEKINISWTGPCSIEGLALTPAATNTSPAQAAASGSDMSNGLNSSSGSGGGSGGVDSSSSGSSSEGDNGGSGGRGVSSNGFGGGRGSGSGQDSTQPAFKARRISTETGLLQLLMGKRGPVSVEGASVDAMLNSAGEFRVLTLLPASPDKPVLRRKPLPVDSALRRAVKVPLSGGVQLPDGFRITLRDSTVTLPAPYREIAGGPIEAHWSQGSEVLTQAAGLKSPATGAEPFEVSVTSPNASARGHGWVLPPASTGGGASTLQLSDPGTASLRYSPALAEYGLGLLNPLLGDAVSLEDSGTVDISVEPRGLRWPADDVTVRVQPLQLTVQRSPILRSLLSTLAVADKSLGKINTVNIRTAELEAVVSQAGPVTTRRTDLLLSGHSGQGGVHLVAWGSVDSQIDGPVEITLGVGSDTLQRLGITIPADQVLPIAVRGTSDAYSVDWAAATSKILALVARERSLGSGGADDQPDFTSWGGFARELIKRGVAEADKAMVVTVPAPPLRHPLPWEEGR